MKYTFLLVLIFVLLTSGADAQKSVLLFNEGVEYAQKGKLDAALKLFNKSLSNDPEYANAHYFKGVVLMMKENYRLAVSSFNSVLMIDQNYAKAYVGRGKSLEMLTDYAGAIKDFDKAARLDDEYADAFFYRGYLFGLLGNEDKACKDLKRAQKIGHKRAGDLVDMVCSSDKAIKIDIHNLLVLEDISGDETYGFDPNNPIKTGFCIYGGSINPEKYFSLIKDPSGKRPEFKRIGHCCAYRHHKAPDGIAFLDQYEITYRDQKGDPRKAEIYFTIYEYEKPKALKGFKIVKPDGGE